MKMVIKICFFAMVCINTAQAFSLFGSDKKFSEFMNFKVGEDAALIKKNKNIKSCKEYKNDATDLCDIRTFYDCETTHAHVESISATVVNKKVIEYRFYFKDHGGRHGSPDVYNGIIGKLGNPTEANFSLTQTISQDSNPFYKNFAAICSGNNCNVPRWRTDDSNPIIDLVYMPYISGKHALGLLVKDLAQWNKSVLLVKSCYSNKQKETSKKLGF